MAGLPARSLDALWAIEEIKQLKARYCRLLDAKQWREWRGLFAPVFENIIESDPRQHILGADEFVRSVSTSLADLITVHQVHSPEIELENSYSAIGTWHLHSCAYSSAGAAHLVHQSFSYYHDRLQRNDDGIWQFTKITLSRHLFLPVSPDHR